MTDLHSLALGCASCRVCEGAAYQTPPVFYAGGPNAPILAVGQNPGEFKITDKDRMVWSELFKKADPQDVASLMPLWYQWDFSTSPGYHRLEQVFGLDWLTEGIVMWSNAVRCRTKNNAVPEPQMIESCKVWTNSLLDDRKAIIMVGNLAKHQVLGSEASMLDWGAPRKHPRLGIIMAIKHYSAWEASDAATYSEAFQRIRSKVVGTVSA
jgi:uracil-DNA glycosylase